MQEAINYLTKFRQSYSLIDLFSYISFYAWERLELYSQYPAKVGEEEITNTLVSEILAALCVEKVELPIRFFHSKNETANGNDLEIITPIGSNHFIIMPCQAKRLYVEAVKDNLKAKYKAIHHPVILNKTKPNEKKEQICYLLEYAHKIKGFPLYLFYNYTKNEVDVSNYSLKKLYGCTLINAYHIFAKYYNNAEKKITPFTFQEIHPPAKPFISIIDFDTDLKNLFYSFLTTGKLKSYTNDELLKQTWWEESCPPFSVPLQRRAEPISLKKILKNKNINPIEEYPFNPKYRIMILREPDIHRFPNVKL